MTSTLPDFLRALEEATDVPYVSLLNTTKELANAELYNRRSRGKGHSKTRLAVFEAANSCMALAADNQRDAPNVVTQLRRMTTNHPEPHFKGTFGDVFDTMIAGGTNEPPLSKPRVMPHSIHIRTLRNSLISID